MVLGKHIMNSPFDFFWVPNKAKARNCSTITYFSNYDILVVFVKRETKSDLFLLLPTITFLLI